MDNVLGRTINYLEEYTTKARKSHKDESQSMRYLHTTHQSMGINDMQSKANIDGNVLFDDMYMAYDPYKMLIEEWISPKGEYTFTKARTAPVLKYTAKGHANIHHRHNGILQRNGMIIENTLLVHHPHMESILAKSSDLPCMPCCSFRLACFCIKNNRYPVCLRLSKA